MSYVSGPQPLEFRWSFDPKSLATLERNIAHCFERRPPVKMLKREGQKSGAFVIVGGGPSARKPEQLAQLRALWEDKKNRVMCMNDAHDWMLSMGMKPWGTMFWEVEYMEGYGRFLKNSQPGIVYLVASQSNPTAFDALLSAGRHVRVWNAYQGTVDVELYKKYSRAEAMFGGGCAGALRGLNIAEYLGFTKELHMFGVDASYDPETGQSHSYYDMRGKDPDYAPMPVECAGRKFITCGYLARQAHDFQLQMQSSLNKAKIVVHGDGLLPWIAKVQFGMHESQGGAVQERPKMDRETLAAFQAANRERQSKLLGGLPFAA